MKEQILLFHFDDEARLSAVRKALLPLHISCRVVPEEEWNRPVGALVGLETVVQEELEAAELTAEGPAAVRADRAGHSACSGCPAQGGALYPL